MSILNLFVDAYVILSELKENHITQAEKVETTHYDSTCNDVDKKRRRKPGKYRPKNPNLEVW